MPAAIARQKNALKPKILPNSIFMTDDLSSGAFIAYAICMDLK